MTRKSIQIKRTLWTAVQFVGSAILLWGTARLCSFLGANRATAAMMLLLEVPALATLGDWTSSCAAVVHDRERRV